MDATQRFISRSGTTTVYGHNTANQSKSGNTYQNVSANISGLTPNTLYHFRIVATNNGGMRFGNDRTFTTLSATGPPVVITNPATLIAGFSATLNGSVDPHGLSTTVYFQYGTTTVYGHNTANQSKSGNTYQNVSANISGLTPNTLYHFRIVATNNGGMRFGNDRTFTTLSATGPPVVITNPATLIARFFSHTQRLSGSARTEHNGLFPGTEQRPWYGHNTANQSKSGNTYQNVSANISGLTPNTLYHSRIVATNNGGMRFGNDRTFTTLSATAAGGHNQPGNVDRRFFSHTQRLSGSARTEHNGLFPGPEQRPRTGHNTANQIRAAILTRM